MQATIDKFGRVVIPKEVRDRLGLEPGSTLSIEEDAGAVHLKPVQPGPRLVQKGRLLVVRGEPTDQPLPSAVELVERDRQRRMRQIGGETE